MKNPGYIQSLTQSPFRRLTHGQGRGSQHLGGGDKMANIANLTQLESPRKHAPKDWIPLTEVCRPTPLSRPWFWTTSKGERMLSSNIYDPLLPDYEYNMTSCLGLLVFDGLHHEPYPIARLSPFSIKLLSGMYFTRAMRLQLKQTVRSVVQPLLSPGCVSWASK